MKKGIQIFSLDGKTVLLTGATGHLGTAMAYCLGEAGARVLVNSRSIENSETLVNKMLSDNLQAEMAIFDVTNEESINKYVSKQKERSIHVLINNAYAGGSGSVEASESDAYRKSYEISVVASQRLFLLLLPNLRKALQESNDASVVNIASMYGLVSPDQRIYESAATVNPPFYGAAKAALLQWTRYAACEFAQEGLRINAISPGPFPSEKAQQSAPKLIAQLQRKVPMGRIGRANELCGPILFLSSSASSYVTGTNLVVDGGWTSW